MSKRALRQVVQGRFARAMSVALACSCLCVLAQAAHSTREDDLDRIRRSSEVFQEVVRGPGHSVAESILRGGRCVVIVPSYKNFALGVGGNYGKGVAMCRGDNGRWGAPVFITVGGASLGPQIGGEAADVVLVFQSLDGLESMLNNKLRIGAAAAGAAGPVGRHFEAATDAAMHAQVLSYALSRGLYIGANINGAIVQPDETGNRALYGHVYWQDVLAGRGETPPEARHLVSLLDNSPWTGETALAARRRAASGQPARRLGLPPLGRVAFTQPPLPFELGINYAHQSSVIGLNGWTVLFGYEVLPRRLPSLRFMVEGGRVSGSEQLPGVSAKVREWTVLAGPRFQVPKKLFAPYLEALFGYGRVTVTGVPAFSSFAWKAGGGIQLNISRQFSVRLIELDFLHTNFNSTGQTDGLVSTGVGFNF